MCPHLWFGFLSRFQNLTTSLYQARVVYFSILNEDDEKTGEYKRRRKSKAIFLFDFILMAMIQQKVGEGRLLTGAPIELIYYLIF